jgi:hypothetical protein
MRRTCHKPAPQKTFRAEGSALSEGETILLGWCAPFTRTRTPFTRTRARASPCAEWVDPEWVDPSRGCVHTRAGMSRQTSAQLLSTCALTRARQHLRVACSGLQGHVPTVLRYGECAMAGWRA